MLHYITGLIRHGLTVAGGYVSASPEDINQVVGAFGVIAGIVWSMVDKYLATKEVK